MQTAEHYKPYAHIQQGVCTGRLLFPSSPPDSRSSSPSLHLGPTRTHPASQSVSFLTHHKPNLTPVAPSALAIRRTLNLCDPQGPDTIPTLTDPICLAIRTGDPSRKSPKEGPNVSEDKGSAGTEGRGCQQRKSWHLLTGLVTVPCVRPKPPRVLTAENKSCRFAGAGLRCPRATANICSTALNPHGASDGEMQIPVRNMGMIRAGHSFRAMAGLGLVKILQ